MDLCLEVYSSHGHPALWQLGVLWAFYAEGMLGSQDSNSLCGSLCMIRMDDFLTLWGYVIMIFVDI